MTDHFSDEYTVRAAQVVQTLRDAERFLEAASPAALEMRLDLTLRRVIHEARLIIEWT